MSQPPDPVTNQLGNPISVAAGNTSVGQNAAASNDPPEDGPYAFFEPPISAGEIGWLAHYRVVKRLGVGGMGFVFEAEDTHLRRTVALKVMRPELASNLSYRQRFVVEARAAASITSENIVTVYQVGTAGDVPFLAMQYLHGESLQARLQREAPLQVGFAMLVARDTAAGLAAAHAAGMIHRDIKPANLWLETDKPGGTFRRTRILDFGLAKPDNQSTKLTATGVIVGTPHYMAPEQASGHDLDARADLFALGCVMYTMLTGELAFDGTSTMAVLMALANHTPPRVSSKNFEVPDGLSDLVAKLLEKHPGKRPPSAQAVVDELESTLAELSGFMPASMMVVGPDGVPKFPSSGSGYPSPNIRMSGGVGYAATQRQPSGPPTPAPFAKPKRGSVNQFGAPAASQNSPATVPGWSAATPVETYSAAGLPAAAPAANPDAGRNWRAVALGAVVLSLIVSGLGIFAMKRGDTPPVGPPPGPAEPIPVGVLFSTSGPMAVAETPVRDATLLAVEEINKAGGVLGRQLEVVQNRDGLNAPESFAKQAEFLYREAKAPVVFGCWTSASRKAVRPVAETNRGLLFYPVQFEGLETSPWVFYLGPTANQQLIPALDYLTRTLGRKRILLVGSDYVYPHAANEIIKDDIAAKRPGVKVVDTVYLSLSAKNFKDVLAAVRKSEPDAIVNTINGSANLNFFRVLRSEFTAEDLPVLSVSLPNTDLVTMEPPVGDYLAGCQFPGSGGPAAKAFVEKIQARYGRDRTTSDAMAAAYTGVHLWAAAATAAGTTDPEKVAAAARGRSIASPLGEIKIDADTQYTWLPARIGKIGPEGAVTVVDGSDALIKPEPYPGTRPKAAWDRFLQQMYLGWDNQWQAPPR